VKFHFVSLVTFLFQKKRKEKLQRLHIQQEQNATRVVTTGRRRNDSDNKQTPGFTSLDTQQQNCTVNHHAQVSVAGIPLEALQDVP
jgi:hypothetical protein